MSELRARLDRIEAENDRDNQLIVRAQARICAREEEAVSLRQQILVSHHLADGIIWSDFSLDRETDSAPGSLPTVAFNRLRSNVARRGIEAMKCQACNERPDDARLNKCGHIYCDECYEQVSGGRCERQSCRKRLRRATEIESILYEGLCTYFGVSFAAEFDSEEEPGVDDSDDSSIMRTPRASRFRPIPMPDQIISPQVERFQSLQPATIQSYDNSSEDDGFDDRSQRSEGYGDDGNSFVSENEVIDMKASFEPDESTGDEEDMSVDSESDGPEQLMG